MPHKPPTWLTTCCSWECGGSWLCSQLTLTQVMPTLKLKGLPAAAGAAAAGAPKRLVPAAGGVEAAPKAEPPNRLPPPAAGVEAAPKMLLPPKAGVEAAPKRDPVRHV